MSQDKKKMIEDMKQAVKYLCSYFNIDDDRWALGFFLGLNDLVEDDFEFDAEDNFVDWEYNWTDRDFDFD